MNFRQILVFLIFANFIFKVAPAQKTYSYNVWELIFSYSNVELSEAFKSEYPQAEVLKSNVRFTAFFHVEHDWHLDLTNNIGFITGFGIRNIGISTNEILPVHIDDDITTEYKLIRRIYTIGVPLAIKFGSFKDHLFFYGGGEYELAIHFKEKYWSGTQKRSGPKTKYGEWLGSQTPLLLPSLFGGIQLPGGINIKIRYYLTNFLNSNYTGQASADLYNVSNLSRYKITQLYYISVSWQFNSDYLRNKDWHKNGEVAFNEN
jgi:hypothetical protein